MTQDRLFRVCTVLLLAAIVVINLLSSYIRHLEAGLGCEPWPACYGVIGTPTHSGSAESAFEKALTPAETAKRAHRAIATALVVLVLIVTFHARTRLPVTGSAALLPYLLIAVVLLLSVIGPASYLKTMPAIASVNLLGGMALLALTWLLWLITYPSTVQHSAPLSPMLVRTALGILIVQIALGSWVSANFAGIACTGWWQCATSAPAEVAGSFWYLRELRIDDGGRVILTQAQLYIHLAHRCFAMVTAIVVCVLGFKAIRHGGPQFNWGVALLIALAVQLLLGLSAVFTKLPLIAVVAHSFLASLLLLVMLRLYLLNAPVLLPSPAHRRSTVR